MDRFDLLCSLEGNASPGLRMGFHLIVSRRADQVEEVVSCAEIELKRQVPVSGQFCPRCLDVYGLRSP